MKNNPTKEVPLYEATVEEIVKLYQLAYLYIMDLKRTGNSSKRQRNAVKEPAWGAAEILYMALYGYTKKTKFAKRGAYIRWNNAPNNFEKRVLALLGPDVKKFLKKQRGEIQEFKGDDSTQESGVDLISFSFKTDDAEVKRRMQQYIEDFDLHSPIDKDILKNLVITQMLIESAHKNMLKGHASALNVKELSAQLKDYTILLGLSKKDRIDLGSERKKGSIAELVTVYEQTLQEYPELEHDFLVEELEMLLDKYERLNYDGEREISAKTFRVISGGYTIEEAREITGRKRKNARPPQDYSPNS